MSRRKFEDDNDVTDPLRWPQPTFLQNGSISWSQPIFPQYMNFINPRLQPVIFNPIIIPKNVITSSSSSSSSTDVFKRKLPKVLFSFILQFLSNYDISLLSHVAKNYMKELMDKYWSTKLMFHLKKFGDDFDESKRVVTTKTIVALTPPIIKKYYFDNLKKFQCDNTPTEEQLLILLHGLPGEENHTFKFYGGKDNSTKTSRQFPIRYKRICVHYGFKKFIGATCSGNTDCKYSCAYVTYEVNIDSKEDLPIVYDNNWCKCDEKDKVACVHTKAANDLRQKDIDKGMIFKDGEYRIFLRKRKENGHIYRTTDFKMVKPPVFESGEEYWKMRLTDPVIITHTIIECILGHNSPLVSNPDRVFHYKREALIGRCGRKPIKKIEDMDDKKLEGKLGCDRFISISENQYRGNFMCTICSKEAKEAHHLFCEKCAIRYHDEYICYSCKKKEKDNDTTSGPKKKKQKEK